MSSIPRRVVPALVAFLAILLVPRISEAKHYRFCFYWHTLTADNSSDIDFMKDEPPGLDAPGAFPLDHTASGARYSFGTFPQQVPVPAGYLDDSGCVNLSTSSSTIYANLFAEQRLNLSNGETVTLRTFPNFWMQSQWESSGKSWTKLPKWIFLLHADDYPNCGASQADRCQVKLKPTTLYSETSNIQATAAWTLKRLASLTNIPFIEDRSEVTILGEDCASYPGNSCAGNAPRIAETGCETQNPPYACHARYKFLIGHEVGHWFHARYGALLPGHYNDTGGEGLSDFDACWSSPEQGLYTHMLFSREDVGGAYNEGFAHFLSTLVFNSTSTGTFDYYKDKSGVYSGANVQVLKSSHSTPDIAADIDPGGVMCNVCGGPADRGVEYDWLAFYWAYYRAAPGEDKPTLADIFLHARDAAKSGQVNGYDKLTVTVQPQHEERWNALAARFGVNKCQ